MAAVMISPLSSERSSLAHENRMVFSNPEEARQEQSFWSVLAKTAKAVLLEDGIPAQASIKTVMNTDIQFKEETPLKQQVQQEMQFNRLKPTHQHDTPALQKGLNAIASSLALLGDTLGSAIEEGFSLVEMKTSGLVSKSPGESTIAFQRSASIVTAAEDVRSSHQTGRNSDFPNDTQLKASRDVAMAMATRAKSLLRELKAVKADVCFLKNRCSQLEEENKRFRESASKGVRPDDDDLVRLQLETLLAEKARLAQQNANYARENQFLHEVVEYHQLTLQDASHLDDSLMS